MSFEQQNILIFKSKFKRIAQAQIQHCRPFVSKIKESVTSYGAYKHLFV